MISQINNFNWMGILIAFAAYFIIGALWFTIFFSKPYKLSLGKAGETLPNKPIFIVGPAICTLAITMTSSILMKALHIDSFSSAIEFSLITGIGYLVANTVNIAINPNIPRPILYACISGSYHLAGISIANSILVAFK